MADAPKPSKLMLDECYSSADDRFLDEFRKFDSYEFLLGFVQKWLQDQRPWARQQIVRYLQEDFAAPGHEVVVKRLFKHFEAQQEHDMLGHFMVAFDRLVRRTRVARYEYDRRSRQSWRVEALFAKPNQAVRDETNRTATYRDFRGRETSYRLPDLRNRPGNRLFSHRTRNYLRRRVWRYFRQLSYRKPMAYVAFVAAAMKNYEDCDFAAGENILDNWSLVHACYFHHAAIRFTANHANLLEGRSLAELTPAPYQLSAWQTPKGSLALVELIVEAKSTLVRLWAMELLQRDHRDAISKIDVATLIKMLSHVDPRVQEFAVELFQQHDALSSLRIESWLDLLDQANPTVLALICDAMCKHVTAERLDNDQLIELVCARPVPVAQMGLAMLQSRSVQRPLPPDLIARLAACSCQALSGEIAAWALQVIGTPERYELNCVTEFFDALQPPMRAAAMDWLQEQTLPGFNDPALWARLIETPFDDVRFRLVESLEKRAALPGRNDCDLAALWAPVILGVHRGGRTKLKAIRQLAHAIATDIRRMDALLPVLAVALRSLRKPERRQALSAIATMACRSPELADAIARGLPELQWIDATREVTA
ncbi:MAG: hypothetical protein HYV60_08830 [Planctomycetia bacterium]|nr:hypothetical protein [Planctomycetia bacterium]